MMFNKLFDNLFPISMRSRYNMNAMITRYYSLIVYLIIIKEYVKAGRNDHKLSHQKDVSEYCRRRVIPSVFLGRHVLEADSQVLHFSRMELPYSCSISVRAESGSNIILVIQFTSGYSLLRSCTEDNHQLLVYEIGETFGGYWGPLPDSVMQQPVNNFTQFYTLKTTQPTTSTEESEEDKEISEEEVITLKSTADTKIVTNDDYIEVEVPLVNVSGNFRVDGEDVQDMLEILNEVTPREGGDYDTNILPLLQFSMSTPREIYKKDFSRDHFKAVSGYHHGLYTLDSRLIFQTINQKRHKLPYRNTSAYSNRRLNFKKKSSTFSKVKTTNNRRQFNSHLFSIRSKADNSEHFSSTNYPSNHRNDSSKSFIDETIKSMTRSQEIIDQIIKSLSQTTFKTQDVLISQKILDLQQNSSVYLLSNTSIYNNETQELIVHTKDVLPLNIINSTMNLEMSESDAEVVSREFTRSSAVSRKNEYTTTTEHDYTTNSVKENVYNDVTGTKYPDSYLSDVYIAFTSATSKLITDKKDSDYTKKDTTLITVDDEILNNTISSTQMIKVSELVTGSMVNHESWENVVQAAPVMAVLLNQGLPPDHNVTVTRHDSEINNTLNENPPNTKFPRKKRYVKPLEIKNAIPRVLTTTKDNSASVKDSNDFVDVQDISHFVEMKDDEIHGRVALRYMRNYVGSTLFNICDNRDLKTRHVYLFNTSRIVIAITNFTMEKMTLVLTPARVMKSKDSGCANAHLECQISGARVCIDAMSACDGVPNCGAYDIYDEDRLLCGVVSNLHHNVYLAACTFLAVLLTLLYTVHYWLKRCVPRVSEAFFVYTDRSENVLNLESIMQSPNDDDDASKMAYGHIFYDEGLYVDNSEKGRENILKKMWKVCIYCCLKKKTEVKETEEENMSLDLNINQPPVRRLFSFAEMELSKISPKKVFDAQVQTGGSIENAYLNRTETHNFEEDIAMNSDDYQNYRNEKKELNILKLLKVSRSGSIKSILLNETNKPIDNVNKKIHYNEAVAEEKELLSTVYDPQSSSRKHEHGKVFTKADVHSDKMEPSLPKRLRFDEETTTIPSIHTNEDNIEGAASCSKPPIVLGTEKLRYSEAEDDIEEQGSVSGREFMRFWSGNKSKKVKKKKRVH